VSAWKREPVAVMLAEGEVLVKHTHDVEMAERLARAALAEENLSADERTPEALAGFRLGKPIVGWFRIVNCLPGSYGEGEGWAWALHKASGPGRGAFPAVEFLP
jgi:hypothetical protein